MEAKLKVLSINTWKCDGAYHDRCRLLAQQIKVLNPDVVLIQESFRTKDLEICTAKYIANILGYCMDFVPSRLKFRKVNGEVRNSYSGLSVLSRFDSIRSGYFDLPSSEKDGWRNVQFIQYQVPFPLMVINTHLTFLKDSKLKLQQLEALKTYIDGLETPVFVAGDFNITPDSEYFNWWKNAFNHNIILAQEAPFEITFPGNNDGKCLDYQFLIPKRSDLTIKESQVVLNKKDPELKIYPSDHFGLMSSICNEK